MNATRRTVLGWILATVIAPPRIEIPAAVTNHFKVEDFVPWGESPIQYATRITAEEVARIFQIPPELLGKTPNYQTLDELLALYGNAYTTTKTDPERPRIND